MAGGGKLLSLVLLMALSTATLAARSHPSTVQSHDKDLPSAFGVSRAYEPCCSCACTRMWPPEANTCMCGGEWEGSCPSVCEECICDEKNVCYCEGVIMYNDCMSNACPYPGGAAQN